MAKHDESKLVSIDGSVMEGGGQILRTASALSVMSGRPLRISNIRSGRPQPGLRTQHLRGLQATASMCGARLEGDKLGSMQIWFYPSKLQDEEINIYLDTAASVGLVIQSLLIASLRIRKRLVLNIEGGATFGKFAPPLQYIQFVLLPLLRKMGHHAEINILRHGFYPVGGARARVMIEPCKALNALNLNERGDVLPIQCLSISSSDLKKPRVAERQARTLETDLNHRGYGCEMKSRYVDSSCPGSGVLLVARTASGCVIGADGLGERGKPAEVVAEEALGYLVRTIDSGATVDEHMSDQILPYMALAEGKSSVIAPALTDHARTNMWVIKQFLPVEFETEKAGGNVRIECVPSE